MRFQKKYRLLLFLCLTISNIYAQQFKLLDSLKKDLSKAVTIADSVNLLCNITWTYGNSNPTESKLYGDLALKKAISAGDSVLITKAYNAAAMNFRVSNNIPKAKQYYKKSAEIAVRQELWENAGWAYFSLLEISIDAKNINECMDYARKSSGAFEKANQPSNALYCYQILKKNNHYPYTDSLIIKTREYLKNNYDDNAKLFLYLQLTYLYNELNDKNEAIKNVLMAMELADKTQNKKGLVKVYSQIAYYLADIQQNYTVALTYFQKALAISLEGAPKFTVDLYLQLGRMRHLLGNDSIALVRYSKGLEFAKKQNHRHSIASSYLQLGELKYQKLEYNKALDYYLQCFETGCDICSQIKFHDALIKIGNVYTDNRDFKNAYTFYQKSLDLANTENNDRARSLSYQSLANYYLLQHNPTVAIKYYSKAYKLSQLSNFLEGQQSNALELSKVYKQQNNYDKAFEFLSLSNSLKDSINKINEIDNLARLETHFDFKNLEMQREKDKAIADAEIQNQRKYQNLQFIGILFLCTLILIIYRGYKRKKKDNILLEEQKLAIKNMSEKVHEADQAKLDFYTNVSHEFRTPLTIILGLLEELKTGVKLEKSITTIKKNSLRLLQLVNHLLDLRKLDVAGMELLISKGNILEFLKGITSSFDELAKKKGISITFNSNVDEATGYFDHDKMEKIFTNLLSNAVKYTNEKGRVKVNLNNNKSGFIAISVKDNGIGIPSKHINNIFNRFYRVSESQNQGSGIGLALMKELVKIHKGQISVESKENIGSTFTVTIPVNKQSYSDTGISGEKNRLAAWTYVDQVDIDNDIQQTIEPNLNQKAVLIVEDNKDLRDFISEIFKDDFTILKAKDGKDGIQQALKYVPDIIISDIMMPNISGIDLVDKLKNDQRTSHIPIILLTAKQDIESRIQGFDKGADEYLGKPFESAILKSRVENLLRIRLQLVEKFSNQFSLQPREITIENADQKFLQKTINFIEKHLTNPDLNIDLLAMELGVSRTQLYRKLKALTDYSANQFIRIIRLKRAAQILKQGQNNIAEVMDATGFSNYSYFNNCFKEYFGESPKEYGLISIKGNLN